MKDTAELLDISIVLSVYIVILSLLPVIIIGYTKLCQELIIRNHGLLTVTSSTSIFRAAPKIFDADASNVANRLIFTRYVPCGNV